MMFKDRVDAGKKLVPLLANYANHQDVIVIALPRGGVVTGYEIARKLNAPLDIVVPRKIGAPMQEELAIGALTQDGNIMLNEVAMAKFGITRIDVQPTIEKEMQEALDPNVGQS